MNPVEITQGKSFKGLATYLLHDEAAQDTAERVGWTQSYNLADADPEQAWRLMVATANSAGALKEAARIKRGKAPKNVVHHYSINFHPDDELTPEIIEAAVAESLAVYGMEHHQALAVEHTDKAHRHVHVMVNLIDPENGMSAATPIKGDDGKKRSKLSNSQRRLSSWAQKFERQNGLKITGGRVANANKRAQGEIINEPRKPRNVHDRQKREGTDRRRDFIRRQYENKASTIQATSERLRLQGRIDWDALKKSYGYEKEAIRTAMSPAMKEAAAEIKERYRGTWSNTMSRHNTERREFDRNDKTTIGKIWHGAAVFREKALDGEALGGFVAAFSKEARRNIVMKKHDRERARLNQMQRDEIGQAMNVIKADFDIQFAQARERFLNKCDDLKNRQTAHSSEVRDAWRDHNAARAAAFAQAKQRIDTLQRDRGRSRARGREPS